MTPAMRHYLWGGEKLRRWGRSGESPLAESWDLSARQDGMSLACDGTSLWEIFQRDFPGREFPLLVKLIDAARDLSVQVHPDDRAARAAGQPFGKSECWYVLEAEPGAKLAIGVEHETDPDEMRRAAEDGTLAEHLHWVTPRPGECYAIPSGQIHALGAGVMVAEFQQNSDTTYRLYDYGRLDADGRPRPLHLERALEVADLSPRALPSSVLPEDGTWSALCDMPAFTLYGGKKERDFPDSPDFAALTALDDLVFDCAGERFFLPKGRTAYVPPHTPLRLAQNGLCLYVCPKGGPHA